jgi:hypothetical protein
MNKLPIVFAQVFPREVQCAECGVAMYATKDDAKDRWHYYHPIFAVTGSQCHNEGLRLDVPMNRVRVVK